MQDALHMQTTPNITRHIMEHGNNTRAQDASDSSISELHSEMISLIQRQKSDIWMEHQETHCTNATHILFGRQSMD